MNKVIVDMGMSLDGFIAGPNVGPHNALGDGGHRIHQWLYDVESWRERQSLAGGQINQDDEVIKEMFARVGAYVMGRRMFEEGEVGRAEDPPFRAPVFVLTHQARESGSDRVERRLPSSPTATRAPLSKQEQPRATRT
jgi:dihydrofolate reductase